MIDRVFWMTILICSCQGRKTIIKKFLSNYNYIEVIQTLHFVFELTSYMFQAVAKAMRWMHAEVFYYLVEINQSEKMITLNTKKTRFWRVFHKKNYQ